MTATFHDLLEVADAPDESKAAAAPPPDRARSVRMAEAVQVAVCLAAESGTDGPSATAARRAAVARLDDDIRRQAFRDHFARFPEDIPELSAVAKLRVSDTDHPAALHPDLVDEVAIWVEHRHPTWATSGDVDATVEEVLSHVAQSAEGVGR